MNKVTFTPRRIGQPDERKKREIVEAYQKLFQSIICLQADIERCLKNDEGLGVDFFLESLQHDTEKFIKEKFVEMFDVSIPGISTEKLIESDLLDIEDIEGAIEFRKDFNKAWQKIKETGFIYPLRLLGKNNYDWELTPDFYEKLEQRICRYTQTPEQNKILEIVENLCESLNELAELDIIRPRHGAGELSILIHFFEVNKSNGPDYFEPADILFYSPRLTKYRTKAKLNLENKSFEYFIR